MRELPQGTASLIRPPLPLYKLWWQFWRRNRDLSKSEYGIWLKEEAPNFESLCNRLVTYVSPGLYWVTADGSEPIVNSALAAGLRAYGTTSMRLRTGDLMIPDFTQTYGALLIETLSHVALRLAHAKLSSPDALWAPAAGEPLQPWLVAQNATISIRCETPNDDHVQRVREALESFVLDDFDRGVLTRLEALELATC